jgi:hypothetical protein
MSLRTLAILKDSAEPIEIAVAAHDTAGADYDWTAQTLKVQAQLLGTDYKVADWETGATAYTVSGRRWLRIGAGMLATARATKGTYMIFYWIDNTDDPVKEGCVLRVT